MTMIASVTLLPALLGFVGRNIDRLGLPHRRRAEATGHESFWYRWSRVLQRRPVAAAHPRVHVPPDPRRPDRSRCASASPTRATSRRATRPARPTTCSREGFGPGFNGPLLLAAETPAGASDVAALEDLSATPEQDPRDRVRDTAAGRTRPATAAIMQVFPTTSPQDEATANLVDRAPRRDRAAARSPAPTWTSRSVASPRRSTTSRRSPRAASRSSSARCCCSRSCC